MCVLLKKTGTDFFETFCQDIVRWERDSEMKKGKNNEKEIAKNKLKKIKSSNARKRIKQQDLSDTWRVIRLKLKPLSKAYIDFQEKRKIKKQKEELRRLKEEEKQRLHEREQHRLQEQEERKLNK